MLFVRSNTFHNKKKKRLEIGLIASFTILLMCTSYQPAFRKFICAHVFLFVIIWENLFFLWESFWILLICENLFLFMIICVNLLFLSVYEHKSAYECHHSKQIFYHQNMVMIFCWFCMFPFYVFCFEFCSFCVWVLFVKQSVFEFIKLSCNIHSFCRIRFFTINIFHGMHLWL